MLGSLKENQKHNYKNTKKRNWCIIWFEDKLTRSISAKILSPQSSAMCALQGSCCRRDCKFNVNELFDASKPTVAVGRSSCARQCGMMERSTTTLDYGCNASYLLWETMQTDREADTLDYGLHLTCYLGQSSRLLPCMKIYRFTAAFSVCWKIWNGSEFCINVERCSQR